MKPLVLCIMDGVGERSATHGNAVALAEYWCRKSHLSTIRTY